MLDVLVMSYYTWWRWLAVVVAIDRALVGGYGGAPDVVMQRMVAVNALMPVAIDGKTQRSAADVGMMGGQDCRCIDGGL